jgi:hypothetical protein
MVMAPHYERARVLQIVIEQAVYILDDPIEEIVINEGKVRVRAGAKTITGTYGYANTYDNEGSPMPGSGNWWVKF